MADSPDPLQSPTPKLDDAGFLAPNPEQERKTHGCFLWLGGLLIVLCVWAMFVTITEKNEGESSNSSPAISSDSQFTPLGQKAMKLKSAHSRVDVIKRLGKPDWIILPSDNPPDEEWRVAPGGSLVFIYRNPGQKLVLIDFKDGYFEGAAAGWGEPLPDDKMPPDEFSSKREDRKKYADVWYRGDIPQR